MLFSTNVRGLDFSGIECERDDFLEFLVRWSEKAETRTSGDQHVHSTPIYVHFSLLTAVVKQRLCACQKSWPVLISPVKQPILSRVIIMGIEFIRDACCQGEARGISKYASNQPPSQPHHNIFPNIFPHFKHPLDHLLKH